MKAESVSKIQRVISEPIKLVGLTASGQQK